MGQDESKSAGGRGDRQRERVGGTSARSEGNAGAFSASHSVRCTCGGLRMRSANQYVHLGHFWRHLGRNPRLSF